MLLHSTRPQEFIFVLNSLAFIVKVKVANELSIASSILNSAEPVASALIVNVISPEAPPAKVISETSNPSDGDIETTAKVAATPVFVTVTVPEPLVPLLKV